MVDPFGVIGLVKEVVTIAYNIKQNCEQCKDNANVIGVLYDKLRRIEDQIFHVREAANHSHASATVYSNVIADLETLHRDFCSISEDAGLKLKKLIKAQNINQRLQASEPRIDRILARVEICVLMLDRNQSFMLCLEETRKELPIEMSKMSQHLTTEFQKMLHINATYVQSALESFGHRHLDASSAPSVPLAASLNDPRSPDPSLTSDEYEKIENDSIDELVKVPEKVHHLIQESLNYRKSDPRLKSFLYCLSELWKSWQIPPDSIDYVRGKGRHRAPVKLGRGAAGDVFAATYQAQSSSGATSVRFQVAVKDIEVPQNLISKKTPDLLREVFLQISLRHDCVLKCYGVCWPEAFEKAQENSPLSLLSAEDRTVSFVIEQMTCNLATALETNGFLDGRGDKLRVSCDVAAALSFLHDHHVVHRDVKPQNVLLRFDSSHLVGFAKLSDFGSSRRAYDDKLSRTLSRTVGGCGTILYMPPEVVLPKGGPPTATSWDVWSYGLLLCTIHAPTIHNAFTSTETSQFSRNGVSSEKAQMWASSIEDEVVREIAIQCLSLNPSLRPSMQDVSNRMGGGAGPSKRETSLLEEEISEKRGLSFEEKYDVFRHVEVYDIDEEIKPCLPFIKHALLLFDQPPAWMLCTPFALRKVVDPKFRYKFEKWAESEDPNDQYNLGVCYAVGHGFDHNLEVAISLFRKAAEAGHVGARSNLGSCFANGDGVERDMDQAVSYYREAVQLGCARAMSNLGLCYANGEGVDRDMGAAVSHFQMASNAGDSRGHSNLGVCFEKGKGVDFDIDRAVQLFKIAAEAGDPRGMSNLGVCYEKGFGVIRDFKKAATLFQLAADIGDVRGKCNLANCYEKGSGVPKDMSRAVSILKEMSGDHSHCSFPSTEVLDGSSEMGTSYDSARTISLFEVAAEDGNARAQFNLALCYASGEGVKRDMNRAISLFQESADAGCAIAQFNLGMLYYKGKDVGRDEKLAISLLQQSANNGYGRAQFNIALCYEMGRIVDRDMAHAVLMYGKAAEMGDGRAQCNLGLCMLNGSGVEQDISKAIQIFSEASKADDCGARVNSGALYMMGDGCSLDEDRAVQALEKASSGGYVMAHFLLAVLLERGAGSPSDLKRAESLFEMAISGGYVGNKEKWRL